MHEKKFTKWRAWHERSTFPGLKYPGVYALAITKTNLTGKGFAWRRDIIYIGMTNSVAGLSGRLLQFDYTISGKRLLHGGADRVRYAHQDHPALKKKLYVAIAVFPCDVRAKSAKDLETMGKVTRFEYQCWAEYVRNFRKLPRFNDKNAPKYSKAVGD